MNPSKDVHLHSPLKSKQRGVYDAAERTGHRAAMLMACRGGGFNYQLFMAEPQGHNSFKPEQRGRRAPAMMAHEFKQRYTL